MKYDFLERGARTNCIKDYEDFFYVLKKHLGGVVQQKYVAYFLNHTSEIMSLMCELGLLKRVFLSGMLVYQLQYSNELSSHNVGKITKDMLIRSALRMEHYKSLGLKTFAEIRKHGTYGNNLSTNINKEILERYDYNLNKKGILIENLTNPENVSILYKLKSQNVFIDGIRVKDRVIRPQISIYNINVEKAKKMANRIAFAYSEIVGMFTDYIAGVEVKPTILIHGFGDLEMFNNLTYQDLLKNHYQEMGCYDLETLQEKVKFNTYKNKSKTPYSNILN
ncbi:MAG: hypothetical protein IJA08_04855 [Clostridia bacterium]|nr:hypothetical protein [Clostridia bacterium]